MIKTISVKQIRKGMYIHELNCSWLDHPFARNQFKITKPADIKKLLKSGIKTLKIDTDKGLDIKAEPERLKQAAEKTTISNSAPPQPNPHKTGKKQRT